MSTEVCSSERSNRSVMDQSIERSSGQRRLSSAGAPDRGRGGEASRCPQAQPLRPPRLAIGLLIYRHGLRVSEACDLRWDDIDLTKRTIIVRRLKGSTDSSHYLEKDEHRALGDLWRTYAKKGIKSAYVFVNERNQPFGRMGIARMIERAGEAAKVPFPVHVHMLRQFDGICSGRSWNGY
jgi:integrase